MFSGLNRESSRPLFDCMWSKPRINLSQLIPSVFLRSCQEPGKIGGSRGRNFRHRKCTVVHTASFWNLFIFCFFRFSCERKSKKSYIFRTTKDYFLKLNILYSVVAFIHNKYATVCKAQRWTVRKSQIRVFADLYNLLALRSFCKCGLTICRPNLFFVIYG
jgi:hypothetical protein